jgi:protein-disulfide isomerase
MLDRIMSLLFVGLSVVASALMSSSVIGAELPDTFRQDVEHIVEEYIKAHPELIADAVKAIKSKKVVELEERRKAAILANQLQIFDDSMSPTIGNPTGSIRIAQFFDYKCSYCKAMAKTVHDITEKDSSVKIIYKEFPILGAESLLSTKAALAVSRQGAYPSFHLALMQHIGTITIEVIEKLANDLGLDTLKLRSDMESEDVLKTIAANRQLATMLGINSTPTLVVETEVVTGLLNRASMEAVIAKAKQNAQPIDK